jgi:hypothetical protein
MEAFQQKRLAEKIIQENWKTPVRSLPHWLRKNVDEIFWRFISFSARRKDHK